jgi:hypothetical protein
VVIYAVRFLACAGSQNPKGIRNSDSHPCKERKDGPPATPNIVTVDNAIGRPAHPLFYKSWKFELSRCKKNSHMN